jgi:hypothetical protein
VIQNESYMQTNTRTNHDMRKEGPLGYGTDFEGWYAQWANQGVVSGTNQGMGGTNQGMGGTNQGMGGTNQGAVSGLNQTSPRRYTGGAQIPSGQSAWQGGVQRSSPGVPVGIQRPSWTQTQNQTQTGYQGGLQSVGYTPGGVQYEWHGGDVRGHPHHRPPPIRVDAARVPDPTDLSVCIHICMHACVDA